MICYQQLILAEGVMIFELPAPRIDDYARAK